MRFGIPQSRTTRTTWRSDAREIAEALGIPLRDRQWVIIEVDEEDASIVDVVVWEAHPPTEYHKPEWIAGKDQS